MKLSKSPSYTQRAKDLGAEHRRRQHWLKTLQLNAARRRDLLDADESNYHDGLRSLLNEYDYLDGEHRKSDRDHDRIRDIDSLFNEDEEEDFENGQP